MSETSVLHTNITVSTPIHAARSFRGSGMQDVCVLSSDSDDSSRSISTDAPKRKKKKKGTYQSKKSEPPPKGKGQAVDATRDQPAGQTDPV